MQPKSDEKKSRVGFREEKPRQWGIGGKKKKREKGEHISVLRLSEHGGE